MLQSLQDKAVAFLKPTLPENIAGSSSAVVWDDLINAFIGAVITYIRGCAGGATTAGARIREGGAVSYVAALKIVKQQAPDLRGKARQAKAHELVAAGKSLTEPEMAELLDQAKDVSVPTAPIGIWPALLLIGFLLCSTSAFAQEGPKGIWPIDEEQNMRLDHLEGEVAKANASFQAVNNRLDNITAAISKITTPTAPQPVVVESEAKTELDDISATLNRMKATLNAMSKSKSAPQPQVVAKSNRIASALNHAPAYEIRNGQTVHTSDQHLLYHGYTREQIVGLSPEQKDRLHGAAHGTGMLVAPAQAQVATVQYEQQCNGRSCRRVRRRG